MVLLLTLIEVTLSEGIKKWHRGSEFLVMHTGGTLQSSELHGVLRGVLGRAYLKVTNCGS